MSGTVCEWCGGWVRLTNGGLLYIHRDELKRSCPGSTRPPKENAEPMSTPAITYAQWRKRALAAEAENGDLLYEIDTCDRAVLQSEAARLREALREIDRVFTLADDAGEMPTADELVALFDLARAVLADPEEPNP